MKTYFSCCVSSFFATQNGEFNDLVGFALTFTTPYMYKTGSSSKPIFTQKLELLGFQIEHQVHQASQ